MVVILEIVRNIKHFNFKLSTKHNECFAFYLNVETR